MIFSHEAEQAEGGGQNPVPHLLGRSTVLCKAGWCLHLWGQTGLSRGSGRSQPQQLMCWLSLGTEFLAPFLSAQPHSP